MSPRSFRGRRPSAPMAISLVALFFAFGGVGWAATQLAPNSVGNKQLKNNAVTFNKIAPSTIGAKRINQSVVQTRVSGTCSTSAGALASVTKSGGVTCHPTRPREFGATAASVSVHSSSTTVASKALPAESNYLVLANPSVLITSSGSGQHVTVTCTLSDGSVSQARTLVETTGATATQQEESIPLQLAGGPGTATLSCVASTLGGAVKSSTTTVTSAINAIETASNN